MDANHPQRQPVRHYGATTRIPADELPRQLRPIEPMAGHWRLVAIERAGVGEMVIKPGQGRWEDVEHFLAANGYVELEDDRDLEGGPIYSLER